MDQILVAMLAVVMFAAFGTGYFIGNSERQSRRHAADNVHSGRNDIGSRARRVQ